MFVLLGTVFVASLLGSLHCVGMCGPFALVAAASRQDQKMLLFHSAAYSIGRLLTYAMVGAAFGAMGLAINQGTSQVTFANWQQASTYLAGGIMVLVGVVALARQLGFRIKFPKQFAPLQSTLQKGFAKSHQLKPLHRALAIGALTSLMPCGWLYTFAISAAGTASPVSGMLLMISFWAGTVPVMIALVLGFNRIGATIQKRVPLMMASLVILIGVFTIAFRAPVHLGQAKEIVSGSELVEQIQQIDHKELPCCCEVDQ